MSKFDQTLKLFVTVGQITAGPPLAPLLGQYDIKPANDFIAKLNEALKDFEVGTPISVSVKRNSKSKNFIFIINGPTLMCLIDNFSRIAKRRKREFLTHLDLFNIARLRHMLWLKYRKESCPPLKSIVKSVIATVRASNLFLKTLPRKVKKKNAKINKIQKTI
jgi:ribosomal protein L11